MQFNYINISLFSLSLNILLLSPEVYNQRNHNLTQHKPTTTSRLLCECELYAPQNYDNDPEMKSVMQDFNRQMSQRFREYGEHMIKNKQKCKEQCDKDIEKIILKDKIEKELKEKLDTLETNINTKDLPICECEKSLTDKVEKGCLGCGVLGSGIAPNVGLFGEVVLGAWKTTALVTAKKLAAEAGAAAGVAAGEAAGKKSVIVALRYYKVHNLFPEIYNAFLKTRHYADVKNFSGAIVREHAQICQSLDNNFIINPTCETFEINIGMRIRDSSIVEPASRYVPEALDSVVEGIKNAADTEAAKVAATKTGEFEIANFGAVESTYGSCQTAIIASIVAIVVIVLIMVIIYLILRYRRKKKMKKKLQYIKLLEE
ncbi:PIR protein, putative [Plasmodium sp. gorilla clade G1]|nr:PIR protein, putative [Plasmodium sp. gorilla clade G1]